MYHILNITVCAYEIHPNFDQRCSNSFMWDIYSAFYWSYFVIHSYIISRNMFIIHIQRPHTIVVLISTRIIFDIHTIYLQSNWPPLLIPFTYIIPLTLCNLNNNMHQGVPCSHVGPDYNRRCLNKQISIVAFSKIYKREVWIIPWWVQQKIRS